MKKWIAVFVLVGLTMGSVSAADGPQTSGLTADQREKDIKAFFLKIREISPLAEAAVKEMGLPNIFAQESLWVEKARAAGDDKAFAQVVNQLRNWVQQFGHGDFAGGWISDYPQEIRALFGVSDEVLTQTGYWSNLGGQGNSAAYSTLPLSYRDGLYVLQSPSSILALAGGRPTGDKIDLPAGAQVLLINGLPVDEWVRNASFEVKLNFDPVQKKLWFEEPFLTAGKGIRGWTATFLLPTGEKKEGFVPKVAGSIIPNDFTAGNSGSVVTLQLNDKTSYMRINTFSPKEPFEAEVKKLQDFIRNLKTEHLIIDIRGNRGGANSLWLEGLIQPMITQPLKFATTFEVSPQAETIIPFFEREMKAYMEAHPDSPWKPDTWVRKEGTENRRVYEVTTVVPALGGASYTGKVSLLINKNAYSASEHLARFLKETGLARIYGQPTQGGGGAGGLFMPILPLVLPESKICLLVETALCRQSDGSLTNAVPTRPDVMLPLTKGPARLDVPSLLADPWIQAVLRDRTGR